MISLCGYGTGATAGHTQPARRIGRLYPVERVGGGAGIRPYVIPWDPATDLWGVAFPAGIVGVTTSVVQTGAGTYNARTIAGWDQTTSGVIAVPAVLPAGYTARLNREWHSASQSLDRVRTAAGYTTDLWMPSTSPHGTSTSVTAITSVPFTVNPDPPPFPSGSYVYRRFISVAPTIGLRKLQYRAGSNNLPPGTYGGTHTIVVSHNANGSITYNPSAPYHGSDDGNVIDYTGSVANSDFTAGLEGTIYWTDWIDAGALTPTLGTLTTFTFSVTFTETYSAVAPINSTQLSHVQFRYSSRVDIPYPFTATGQGDLIAPGGLVT